MYNKFIKIILYVIVVLILFQTIIVNASNSQKEYDKEIILLLNLLPKEIDEYLNRYTIVYSFSKMVKTDYEKYTFDNSFFDVPKDAYEYKTVAFAVEYGLFKGKGLKEGKTIADLNSLATWREALTIALRCFPVTEIDDKKDLIAWSKIYGLDEFKVNQKNLIDVLDENISYDDFCSFLNKVLHTPYLKHQYRGEFVSYYIDNFLISN